MNLLTVLVAGRSTTPGHIPAYEQLARISAAPEVARISDRHVDRDRAVRVPSQLAGALTLKPPRFAHLFTCAVERWRRRKCCELRWRKKENCGQPFVARAAYLRTALRSEIL